MRKHINDKIVENIDNIWISAIEKKKERRKRITRLDILDRDENQIEEFYNDFKLSLTEYRLIELKKLDGKETTIFKQKVTIDEIVKGMKINDIETK